ncbi:hypothetical protein [uncultured Roseobacter sp.]|nr:hypothetical protein [uncultured Roseobacter sp.]
MLRVQTAFQTFAAFAKSSAAELEVNEQLITFNRVSAAAVTTN